MSYTDITSDGGMDPRNDPDSDAARLERHRKFHDMYLHPHPDVANVFRLDAIETDHLLRAKLIDIGWTPPNPHTIEPIPTVAWQHPARADLVSNNPTSYTGPRAGEPRELVRKDAVLDRIEWLEHGVDEWRATALAALKKLKDLETK